MRIAPPLREQLAVSWCLGGEILLRPLKLVPDTYELASRQVTVVLIAVLCDADEKILLRAQCAPLVSTDSQGIVRCISSFLPLSRKPRSSEGLDRVFVAVRGRSCPIAT